MSCAQNTLNIQIKPNVTVSLNFNKVTNSFETLNRWKLLKLDIALYCSSDQLHNHGHVWQPHPRVQIFFQVFSWTPWKCKITKWWRQPVAKTIGFFPWLWEKNTTYSRKHVENTQHHPSAFSTSSQKLGFIKEPCTGWPTPLILLLSHSEQFHFSTRLNAKQTECFIFFGA